MVLLFMPSAAIRMILDRLDNLTETFEALLKRNSFFRRDSDNSTVGAALIGINVRL